MNEPRDSEGVPHHFPEGEEDLHRADPMCGCNPDWTALDEDPQGFWYHSSFKRAAHLATAESCSLGADATEPNTETDG